MTNLLPGRMEAYQARIASREAGMAFLQHDFSRDTSCDERNHAEGGPHLQWSDSLAHIGIWVLGGEEFRSRYDGVWATEAGGIASGRMGPASFRVDARTFVEMGERPGRPSFDGEIIDEQTEEVSGALDYRSYSRFRGDMDIALPIGVFTVARDAAHWGPGVFGNLMLNQSAAPYYQYIYSTRLGPLHVESLYGDLLIGENQSYSSLNLEKRSLYGHRYELEIGPSFLLGFSEQLILYRASKPYLFAPVFPLFIAKGFLFEDNTNGSMALDAAWRTPFSTLLYGQFLLDDLESPSSLFTADYVQNKWAVLAGAHWSGIWRNFRVGAIAEFSHVEPWVYGHFTPSTAQAANLGRPLGNPYGADSRTVIARFYASRGTNWYAGLKPMLAWKGLGKGAGLENPAPKNPTEPKIFLEGDPSPEFSVEPEFAWSGRWLGVSLSARLGKAPSVRAGIRVFQ